MNPPVEEEVFGVAVECRRLPFESSQPMLPDVLRFVAGLSKMVTPQMLAAASKVEDLGIDGVLKIMGGLDPDASAELMGIILKHEKKLLATTIVTLADASGALERYELGKAKDRAWVFDQRPDLFVSLCVLAGRVTFARFFPGFATQGDETPAQ